MFVYPKTILLKETDATGVLYFSDQLSIGLEAFEAYFQEKKGHLHDLMEKSGFFLPIVHVEGEYLAPLRAGDQVIVELFVERIGTKSFTLSSLLKKGGELVGKNQIVHVALSRKEGVSIPIPKPLLSALQSL